MRTRFRTELRNSIRRRQQKVFSHEWVFPKIKRQRFFPQTTGRRWGFSKIKRQRFFPNRRLGFSKIKRQGCDPKRKRFFPNYKIGFFLQKARQGMETTAMATGRPQEGHRRATGRPQEGQKK